MRIRYLSLVTVALGAVGLCEPIAQAVDFTEVAGALQY